MKKNAHYLIIGLYLVFPGSLLFAQNSQKNAEKDFKTNLIPSHRDLAILQNHDLTGAHLLARNEIDIGAVRDFVIRFDKVETVLWFADTKGGYEAYFVQDGYGDRVIYDKGGGWQESLITYNEDQCPRDMRAAIKSLFVDSDIVMVEEVHTSEGVEFIFFLQDKTNIRIVRVNKYDEVEVLQELNRN